MDIQSIKTLDNLNSVLSLAKISGLATVSPSTITLADNSTPATVENGDVISLTLQSSFGTKTIDATFGASGWSAIASELTADLTTNDGYTIVAVTDGIKITRSDGATFTVAAASNASGGTWSLTDGTNTVSMSSDTASGSITVTGSGLEPNALDYANIGLTGVTSGNVGIVNARISALSVQTDIDTLEEIRAYAFPPTQTITITGINEDSGSSSSDFLTNDADGITVTATLSAPLGTGQSLFILVMG